MLLCNINAVKIHQSFTYALTPHTPFISCSPPPAESIDSLPLSFQFRVEMASVDVGNLIVKLIPLLNDEVMLLTDVRSKIEAVQAELSLIQAYLKDADAKAEMGTPAVKEWVKQLRHAAFGIQDAVDLYLFRVAPKRPQRQRHRSVGMLSKIGFVMRTVVPRHKFTCDIVNTTASIRRLREQKKTLGLSPSAENGFANTLPTRARLDLRMGAHFLEEDELVGVDYAKSLLNGWLINVESKRTVIAVVGEGGLGKTTIVKNIYNKYKENMSFECCAWITMSRSFQRVEHLLKALLQSLYENDGNQYVAHEISEKVMDKDTLTQELYKYLQGRSYMIVFDDVREKDFWGGVEFALPKDRNNRCRIIITTRDKGVAEFCQRSAKVLIHVLEPLPPDDAMVLFRQKTFQFDPQGCPKDLDELSKAFVEKCEGVPLAIVAISSLLSTKTKNVSEWKKVYDSLRSKLSSDPHLESFRQVLSESYYDLPYHLKLCLLYFGLFPEGYTITRTRLIRLWIAEGFVKENELYENQTLEEAAEEYLAELLRRSLVKVFDVHAYGGVESCKVHELMHNFIFKTCEELNFCQVMKDQQFRFHEWTRRLSIHKITEGGVVEKDQNYGRVRSCIVCDTKQLPDSMLKSLLSNFKLLVTLDVEDSPLDHLPKTVGNLLNLKYLSVRKTKIKTIPKFIGKLQKLEILDIGDTKVRELPVEINRLVKLQHLFSSAHDFRADRSYVKGVKLNEGIGALTALQSLVMVDTTTGDGVIREMENLKNMRRLGILSKDNGNAICNAIMSMPRLCSLEIMAGDQHEVLELQSLVDPPIDLQRLYLEGHLGRLPEWIPKLKHLVKLRLRGSRIVEDPLPILKDLPELLELVLDKAYDAGELHFKSGWFIKLKCLSLAEIDGLTTLKIAKGALPNLEILWLWSISQMVQVPHDIQNLEALRQLDVYKMPSQFVDDIFTGWKKNTKLRIVINPTRT